MLIILQIWDLVFCTRWFSVEDQIILRESQKPNKNKKGSPRTDPHIIHAFGQPPPFDVLCKI